MTTPRRILGVLVPLLIAASAAATVTGHAASLSVTSARVDTFAATQAAPTTMPTNQTGPLLVDVSDSDTTGSDQGRFSAGDWIEFHLDAAIDTTTVPSTVTVVVADPTGAGNDRMTIVGILAGPTDLGSDNYYAPDGSSASFAATATLTSGGPHIRITLGACSSGCSGISRTTSGGSVTFTLATTIKGTNGVAVTGSVTKTGYRVF